MAITVKFFASLREQLANPINEIDSATVKTVADVWEAAADIPMPDHVLCSVNLDHRAAGDAVADGDEVAFFPPVTGG
jgi:molybdopterin synthase sulfur carrier subunit